MGEALEKAVGTTVDVIASLRPNTYLGGAELQVHSTVPKLL